MTPPVRMEISAKKFQIRDQLGMIYLKMDAKSNAGKKAVQIQRNRMQRPCRDLFFAALLASAEVINPGEAIVKKARMREPVNERRLRCHSAQGSGMQVRFQPEIAEGRDG
ncbi:hypothetical protein EPK99_24300 [Neorhizobium lilium]|uniref:Uncharacterized protein n=1 Tax=Neorhizobium lilium TaxID=2503024 RepID=A0A3S3VHE0_9HYPH|nr:hypothetical protein [Neorhizobium lilium]RWX74588.1 hypothetical protein EPK99_24300 [Neorhizobium lilium]